MIVFTENWTRLDISFESFCEIAHDSTIPMEFVFQEGEIKLQLYSPKYVCNSELNILPNLERIPYCLHIKGVESMNISSDGHPDLFIMGLKLLKPEFLIDGANGKMCFSGKKLAISFLRDDHSFAGASVLAQIQVRERKRV